MIGYVHEQECKYYSVTLMRHLAFLMFANTNMQSTEEKESDYHLLKIFAIYESVGYKNLNAFQANESNSIVP